MVVDINAVLKAKRDAHEQERKQVRQKRLMKLFMGIGLLGVLASTGLKFVLGYLQTGTAAAKTEEVRGTQDQGYILYSATGMVRLTQAEYDAMIKQGKRP